MPSPSPTHQTPRDPQSQLSLLLPIHPDPMDISALYALEWDSIIPSSVTTQSNAGIASTAKEPVICSSSPVPLAQTP